MSKPSLPLASAAQMIEILSALPPETPVFLGLDGHFRDGESRPVDFSRDVSALVGYAVCDDPGREFVVFTACPCCVRRILKKTTRKGRSTPHQGCGDGLHG